MKHLAVGLVAALVLAGTAQAHPSVDKLVQITGVHSAARSDARQAARQFMDGLRSEADPYGNDGTRSWAKSCTRRATQIFHCLGVLGPLRFCDLGPNDPWPTDPFVCDTGVVHWVRQTYNLQVRFIFGRPLVRDGWYTETPVKGH